LENLNLSPRRFFGRAIDLHDVPEKVIIAKTALFHSLAC